MPIYFVIYQYLYMPSGFGIKNILHVIPTVLEKADNVYRENIHLFNGSSLNPMPQCEYWARHDESVLENAAKGE